MKQEKYKGYYLVDTNIIIQSLRGNHKATKYLQNINFIISYVTYFEILQGARDKKEQKKLINYLDKLNVDWGGIETNIISKELYVRYHLSNNLHIFDSLIAGTAMLLGITLVTENIKHFQFLEGFEIMKPDYDNSSNLRG